MLVRSKRVILEWKRTSVELGLVDSVGGTRCGEGVGIDWITQGVEILAYMIGVIWDAYRLYN
jgi:hypothetical protein